MMLAASLLLAQSAAVLPGQPPSCAFGRPATSFARLLVLPLAARTELQRVVGGTGVADAGEPFQATDVATQPRLPRTRFIRAYDFGRMMVVWWEHGGIAHSYNTLALQREGDGSYRALPGSWLGGNLCRATTAILNGVRAGG